MAGDKPNESGSARRTLPKPKGILRWLLRLPVWLYRHGLGWLMGSRFIMLQHVGRKSGKQRYTVVEVVRHDPQTGIYVIASGWGERADWYRNVRKTPELIVHTGRERIEMRASRLAEHAAARELLDYARHHPAAFRALSGILMDEPLEASAEGCESMAEVVPVIRLTPRTTETS
ncbi:MAG: nitroreductase family deazaflavin-dependent oxidoreductase [Anaerolineae bacterium]